MKELLMDVIIYYTVSRKGGALVVDAFSDKNNYNYNNFESVESLKNAVIKQLHNKYNNISFIRLLKKNIITE